MHVSSLQWDARDGKFGCVGGCHVLLVCHLDLKWLVGGLNIGEVGARGKVMPRTTGVN
jgi:hypothetical protein